MARKCKRCSQKVRRSRAILCEDCVREAGLQKKANKVGVEPLRLRYYALKKRSGAKNALTFQEFIELRRSPFCGYCGFDLNHPLARPEIDHIVPVSQGGTSQKSNLVRVCRMCNRAKGTMTYSEFMTWLNHVRGR